jgi:thiol-disulfide isomerase/thioredoxin
MNTMRPLLLSLICFWVMDTSAQMAPDFTITDSHGNEHTLYADYLDQGKTVLIKIFFTTCPPCNAIASYMEPLYEDWGSGNYDVEFFELSDKNFDTDVKVNTYQTNHGQTYPAAGYEGGSLAAVAPYEQGQFGPFYGTPTFIVIAPDGTMDYDVRGFNNAETIAMIDAAIAATGAMQPECTVTVAVNESICPGDSVQVRSTWYDAVGTYEQIVSDDNCDTLLWITIVAAQLEESIISTSFCTGEGIQLYGRWYDVAGTYQDTIMSITGTCDTLVTIFLTEDPLHTRTINSSFTEGDSVQLYGSWYSAPGTFPIVSESTTGGCDTVVTLIVTEIPATDTDIIIGGKVRTYGGASVALAVVIVKLGANEIARDTTDVQGNYSFTMDSAYVINNDLVVGVSKNINPKNGVSVLDIVALQKHLLGLQLLNSTDKLFAADVNKSGTISGLDIVEMRKLLLGLNDGFPNAGDPTWLFFHDSVTFGAPGVQPPVIPIQDPILLRQIHQEMLSGNFRGLKLGDLNDTVNPQD